MAMVALLNPDTMMGPLRTGVVWEGEMKGEKDLLLTFPSNISREDFERMKTEIVAALEQARRRGEQKALAKIAGRRR